MKARHPIHQELSVVFPDIAFGAQATTDGMPTLWVPAERIHDVLRYLKRQAPLRFPMLYDLTVIDERARRNRPGQPASDFTVVYQLLSFERNHDVRLKVPLLGAHPSVPSVSDLWANANWYEREAWDLFGVRFEGHPDLRRLLLPPTWQGHPLRKEHPARATEMGPYRLTPEKQQAELAALQFQPEEWGMKRSAASTDFMFLNLGPNHPSVHGVFRILLQLDGEEIIDAVPDIGFHHRGAEKMGERQTWHTYIPYTDRIDYVAGLLNNLPYVLAVEQLAGIEVPERVQTIRVMLAELWRIISHLVFYGTFTQDLGQLSPIFYMFSDRERLLYIMEALCGGRMHPQWFRVGGVTQDLPNGWERLLEQFLRDFPKRLNEYDKMVMQNRILQRRTRGIGSYGLAEAMEWGVTGPGLRACGVEWDFRKARPYSGYERFEFDVPIATHGDSYDRCLIHVEEMRQSLRIIRQCVDNMPLQGDYKAEHPLTTPPPKAERTLHDIETLITHFLGVSWGPVIPAGECAVGIESAKGNNTYYLISDGGNGAYRTRIRTPSFPHLQMIPRLCRGLMVADLVAILGSIDFVMADVDR